MVDSLIVDNLMLDSLMVDSLMVDSHMVDNLMVDKSMVDRPPPTLFLSRPRVVIGTQASQTSPASLECLGLTRSLSDWGSSGRFTPS